MTDTVINFNNTKIVMTIAALRLCGGIAGDTIFALGYSTAGDGGQGQFWANTADTSSADNNFNIIVGANGIRWYLLAQNGYFNNKQAGAKCDGVTDDTVANNRLLANCKNAKFVGGRSLISASLTPTSNTDIELEANAGVDVASATFSPFLLNNVTRVNIHGYGSINFTAAGATPYIGAVLINNGSTYCRVENLQITGCSFAGVMIDGAFDNTVTGCNFLGFLGTIQDSADVLIYNNAANNNITRNFMFGGNWHGCLVQDPYSLTGLTPKNNRVDFNIIGQHTSYGVAVYIPAAVAQSFTVNIPASSTVVTISGYTTGAPIAVGQALIDSATGQYYGTIQSLGTSTGGNGTVNVEQACPTGVVTNKGCYACVTTPTNNSVTGNDISNILGSATNRSSGSGIYVVGAGVGGTSVHLNKLRNCNSQTLDRSLAPGSIGINSVPPFTTKVSITENEISENSQGDGINVVNSLGSVFIGGNNILIPATNNGTGVGGGSLAGSGIRIETSGNATLMPNDVLVLGTGQACLIYANGLDCANINMTGGTYKAVSGIPFATAQTSTFFVKNLNLTGVAAIAPTNLNYAFSMAFVQGMSLTGCNGLSVAFEALHISNCTNFTITGGTYNDSGATPSILTAGTCTNGFIDRSVNWGGNAANMSNSGVGCNVEFALAAAPAAGTWRIGDSCTNVASATGAAVGWKRITNGSGNVLGTDWKALANL